MKGADVVASIFEHRGDPTLIVISTSGRDNVLTTRFWPLREDRDGLSGLPRVG